MAALVVMSLASFAQNATAQACFTCPAEASATASASSFAIFVQRGGNFVNVTGDRVGACEVLLLVTTASYQPNAGFDPLGNQQIGAAYTGGRGRILLPDGTFVDVTPADLATTIIGPTANGSVGTATFTSCGPDVPAGFSLVDSKAMNNYMYALAAADVAAGAAVFRFDYDQGTALLPDIFGNCNLTNVTAGQPQSVLIDPLPTCSIQPASQTICVGASATFTANVAGSGPFMYCWQKDGAGACLSTAATLTINNASLADTGTYVLTVTDRFGCVTTCEASLVVMECIPEIDVLKEVACLLPGDACGPFSKVATGVKDSGCPAFCYRVTVSNVGTIPIVSLSVNDPELGGDISSLFGPLPIAPGDSRTAIISPITHCEDTPNTVVAEGASDQGFTDVDQDSAEARVLEIDINCELELFSSFDMSGGVGCLQLPESTTVELRLTVRNAGTAPLNVVGLDGLPPDLMDCETGELLEAVLPFTLGPGEAAELIGCVPVACPEGRDFSVTARAEADDADGTLCIYDEDGNLITDETTCTACATCAQPELCRVTGGGTLLPGTFDESCITVETTIFPLETQNGLPIKKITHGGQLGAPFSQLDCGEILGNPCIRGQWQHTRHYVGKGNPRDVIDMNFHSATPKGQFDSLLCACLGCCDPEAGEFISPLVVNGLCNPDDHKVCGPQPRPAPANAIIFSGIGRMSPETDEGVNHKFAEWVIFRVYIEDRSEPGGFHPKGAVQPADIYCFQAWKTGIRTSRKPDFSTIAPEFRAALGEANCDFLNALQSGALPIGSLPSPDVSGIVADVQDCGPMHDGNHQIHPATGADCDQ